MKKRIVEIIIQIIPVMIGVWLGFGVSSWGEQRTTNEHKEIFVQNILNEMETNSSKINDVFDYHNTLRDSARYQLRNNMIPNNQPSYFKGLRTPPLVQSAFDTGKQTGIINELSFDQIQAINRVYTQQAFYDYLTKTCLTSLINMDFSEKKTSMKKILNFIAISMTDITIQEKALQNSYEQMKTILKEE